MATLGAGPFVEFQDADLELFSAASLDRNPLHLSHGYARQTAYGERVVFGALAALACFGHLPRRTGCGLTRLTVEFKKPVFARTQYRVEVAATEVEPEVPGEDATTLRLLDGSQLLLKAILRFGPGSAGPSADAPLVRTPPIARAAAADLRLQDIIPGAEISGAYAPSIEQLEALLDRFDLANKGVSRLTIVSLLACSYLVGMELPGTRALFSHLDLKFETASAPALPPWPLTFHMRVSGVDQRFELVSVALQLRAGNLAATGQLRSFIRTEAPSTSRERIEALLPAGETLRDKTALVIGGSRGLGASIALTLANRGAKVLVGYHKSSESARRLERISAGSPGSVEAVLLDAGDPVSCAEVRRTIIAAGGRLDLLICNASPPLLSLRLEPASAGRIGAFVATAVAQVSVPMATFVDLLAASKGVGVVISSAAVKNPPADWPHYVSAKVAVEMLAKVASLDVPFIVVRPPSLLTDMTNTPVGRANAIAPESVAVALVRRLEEPPPQVLEILEDFSPASRARS